MSVGLKLYLRLYGPFEARWSDGVRLKIPGAKLKAILAILATDPHQEANQVRLQDLLWSRAGAAAGRASLRKALSQLRALFEDRFDSVFDIEGQTVRLRTGIVMLDQDDIGGAFLEGLDIGEEGFEDWLRDQRANPLPAKPRPKLDFGQQLLPMVAAIPFQVLMPPPGGELIGDMLAQEITRALSKSQFLRVISHLSARRLDSTQIILDDVNEAIGADYLICGSLRLVQGDIKVVVDLVDVASGGVLWTRDFQGDITSFLNGESELVWEIASQAGRGIIMSALELASLQPLPTVESHTLLMSGIGLLHRQNTSGFARARLQIEEVLSRVPNQSIIHAWLAKWHVLNVQQGWSSNPAHDAQAAAKYCNDALELNPDCTFTLSIDGFVKNNMLKRLDEAANRFDEAIAIDPNNAFAWLLKGTLLAFEGHGQEAVACTTRARRLSPLDPYGYFFDSLSATACASAEDYEGALKLANKSLITNRRHASTLRVRTVSLELLGRHPEAVASAKELLRIDPDFTIEAYISQHPSAMFKTGRNWAKALASAGVPEN